MATEAQVVANRANAQKSTGPRTPEGKEKASQNSLKHGLLAREAVVTGEDYDEFELYRQQLRAELAPVGLTESLLVERIAGLSWRLQRAERFHTEAFDVLYAQCAIDPQTKRWHPAPGPDAADPIVGLTVVKDFSQTKVLERLLVYERRIENSLYRTMAELRKVQGQREAAAGVPGASEKEPVRDTHPTDFTLDNLLAGIAALEETPAGATTNAPVGPSCETNPIPGGAGWDGATGARDAGQSRETNPISPAGTGPEGRGAAQLAQVPHPSTVPSFQDSNPRPEAEGQLCETNPICGSPSSTGILPVDLNHGRDAHATVPDAQGQLCETNPICVGPGEGQSLCDTWVRSDPAPTGLGETKPISAGANQRQAGYRPIFRRRG